MYNKYVTVNNNNLYALTSEILKGWIEYLGENLFLIFRSYNNITEDTQIESTIYIFGGTPWTVLLYYNP